MIIPSKTSMKGNTLILLLICNYSVITNAFYNGIHRTTFRRVDHLTNHQRYSFIDKSILKSSTSFYSTSSQEQQKQKETTASTIGTIVSYEASTSGNNGIAVVKLNDDDSSTNNSNSLGDDYTGRSVEFNIYNDDTNEIVGTINGIVLIQRTPYIFIYYNDNDLHNLFTFSNTSHDSIKVNLSSEKQCINYDFKSNALDYPTLLSSGSKSRELYANIPNVSEIELINEPCLTGLTSVDVMCPIGKGQNMLFISNDNAVRRNIIKDIITTQQSKKDMKIVYGATTYKGHDKQVILSDLIDNLDNLILVSTEDGEVPNDDNNMDCIVSAAEGICIALSSCSIGELYARDATTPSDVLVIIDTIHPFKTLWDYTSKYILQSQNDIDEMDEEQMMIASKSSDSEMRSYFSNIIQRSCNLKQSIGGSISLLLFVDEPSNPLLSSQEKEYSFTMQDFEQSLFNNNNNNDKLKQRIQILLDKGIPLTVQNCQKLEIPIPSINNEDGLKYNQYKSSMKFIDDLISMTDGQIYLKSEKSNSFTLPKYPPIHIQKSLTRIGIGKDTVCRADAKVIQKISSGLRLELLYGLDNIDDLTEKKRIRYQAYLNIMEQSNDGVRSLVDSIILLLAVKLGFMDSYVVNQQPCDEIQKDLLVFVKNDESAKGILGYVQEKFDFSDDGDEQVLNDCVTSFFNSIG